MANHNNLKGTDYTQRFKTLEALLFLAFGLQSRKIKALLIAKLILF